MDAPQLYLITPRVFSLSDFPPRLARLLDEVETACLRLSMEAGDADDVARAADALRPLAHERDIPLVVEDHVKLAAKLGLDGVHVSGTSKLRDIRKEIGPEAILGCHCGTSRHDGLGAGEAGANYVAFGPAGETGLGSGETVAPETFEWWSEMIELPVVAEGGLTAELVTTLAPITDFLAIGPEIWGHDDPVAALRTLLPTP